MRLMEGSRDAAVTADAVVAPDLAASGRDPDALRSTRLFLALVAIYALAIAVLYVSGQIGFFFKTVIVPSLFLVAYLARRFAAFVRDWSAFLGVTVLFDNVRGLVYGLILQLQLPVHMGYAIAAEQALFGSPIPNVRLQRALFSGEFGPLEKLLVLVHASHFLLFLLVGLRIWLTRPRELVRFCWSMSLVMYGAIVGYLLVPTVPPWMASTRYYVLPEITQMPRQIYNLQVPTLSEAFDVNPIAAMPSLHAAFPAMLWFVCVRHFGRAGWGMALYALLAWFGIVYMGEHYIVDVLAGIALAGGAYLLCYRVGPLARWLGPRGERALVTPTSSALRRSLLIAALLLVVAQGTGALAEALAGRDVPTEEFVARELDGKSPMASYYRGLRAYYAGDCTSVARHMTLAASEVPDADKRARAGLLRGECAYRMHDFATALALLREQRKLSAEQALMLADAELSAGDRAAGTNALKQVLGNPQVDPAMRDAALRLAARHKLQ